MRKAITYVNIALLLAAVWLAAGTRTEWRKNNVRYAQFAAPVSPLGPVAAVPAAGGPPPLSNYAEVVDRNLFFQDRNNLQPLVEKKPAPPLPVAIGTMNLGSGMVALMGDAKMAAERAFRRVKEGDEIGGWRIVEIAEHKVVLEFEGEKKTIDVYESAASTAPAPAYTPPAASAGPRVISASQPQPAQTAAAPEAPATAPAAGVSVPTGAALPKDPLDPYKTCVAMEGNRMKCTRLTAFGPQVWIDTLK